MNSNYSTGGAYGNVYVSVTNQAPTPLIECSTCKKSFAADVYTVRHNDGQLRNWCGTCLKNQLENRNPVKAFFLALPPRLRHRVYRVLATVLHPDQGGDEAIMQQLNAVKLDTVPPKSI